MSETVPPTDEQLMTCFAAYHVAEHALRKWRIDCVTTLIAAVQRLPEDADATPVIQQAHEVAGDFWTLMSNNGANPSYRSGVPLTPATTLSALRNVAGGLMVELMDYVPGAYDSDEVDRVRQMDQLSVQDKINGYREAVDLRGTQSADLAARIDRILTEATS